MDNKTIKRYIVSSAITFLSAFLLVLSLQIGEWDVSTLTSGTVVGSILVAFRVGIKALAEYLITLIK